MATAGGGKKGGKKKKGQTVPLTAFLADTGYVAPPKKLNWAEESDDSHGPLQLAEEYGGPPMDLRNLPSAPRASRSVDLDLSRLPSKPPYTAFLGNLPFDVTEEDIKNLFRGLRVENIRFPQEAGRVKGFGYAEFFDIDQLKSALALSNEKIRSRQIRIDIADQAGKDPMGRDNRGGGGFDDKTSGDWRRDDGPTSNDSRQDDRRGGPGGYRDDRRGDREPRALGPADTDDCWRRDDGPANPPTQSNTWGNDRGGRGRDDSWGGRSGGGFRDDRGGGGFRDDRGGRSRDGWGGGGGFRDDRGGGFRDDRGGGFRDDRGGGGFRDDRGGGGFRDDRGGGGFRDDRGGGGFRDDRGGGGFRDDRGGGGFRDDRGGGGFRDDRGGGGFRDDRGGGGFRDDRGGGGPRDGGRGGGDRPDDGPRPDEPPTERRKLNLKPRTVEPKVEDEAPVTPAKSSIFGNAKPVDTATKERLIEEKLSSLHVNGDVRRNDDRDFRGRRDRSGDRPRERSRDGGRGRSRDGPRENIRDAPRERSRETSQEYIRDGPRARSRDGRRGDNRDDTRDVREGPRDGYDSGRDGSRDFDDRNSERDRPRNFEQDRERERPRDRERPPVDGYSSADNYPQNGDSRREFRDAGGDGEPENWRDEGVRHDKPRVMRPDLVTEADKDDRERTISDSSDKSREDMSVLKKPAREDENRGPAKSPKGKKWNKDGPVVPPKYEEPPQPVFSQVSRFAALGMYDDEDGSSGENKSDEEDPET